MKKIIRGLLFVLLGIPGVFIFILSLVALFDYYTSVSPPDSPLRAYLYLFVSGFMTLAGAGKLREWRYIFVFISIPISIFAYSLFTDNTDLLGYLFFALVIAIWTNAMIKQYYKRKQEKREMELDSSDSQDNNIATEDSEKE